MSSEPAKYRKKPVVIEAMQWADNAATASDVIDWILSNGGSAGYDCKDERCTLAAEGHVIGISTLEGRMQASHGDFIIRGVQGEFYPCKPDIFAATYEAAEAQQ